MLTARQVAAALRRFTFWPGWTFLVYEHPHEGTWIRVQATVPNAYRPDETTELDIHSPLPPMPDEAYLATWLDWRCQLIALHEAREWARFDGKPVSDPHAPWEYEGREIVAEGAP